MIGTIRQARTRDTEWVGPSAFGMLAMGALALLGIAALGPGTPDRTAVAQLASVQLTDDDGDQALFPNSSLVPGRPVSRCLSVSYAGESDAGQVRLAATDVTGPLAEHLHVQVEVGSGGGFATRLLPPVEQQRAPDQAQVAVCLRVVAQPSFGLRVVLLGQ